VSFWLHESRVLRLLRGLPATQRFVLSCIVVGGCVFSTHHLRVISVSQPVVLPREAPGAMSHAMVQQGTLADFLQLLAHNGFSMVAVERLQTSDQVLVSGKTSFFVLQQLLKQVLKQNLNAIVSLQSIVRERDGVIEVKFLCKGPGGKRA
jgi:hypothetical protein